MRAGATGFARRRAVALLGTLCIAATACIVGVTGCTKTTSAPTIGERHPWTHPRELIIGSAGEEPDNLNEMFAHSDATDQIANLIDEPLFRYDPNGEYLPAAVREVPTLRNGGISRDGKTIVLHFRPRMRWSDGAPYDARDFVFTWHAVMNPRNNTKLRAGWDEIASIGLSADHLTATVHLKQVYASILGIWAYGGAGYPPLPAHLLQNLPDLNRAPYNTKPISSGPFVLTRWNHGSSLEFAPNPYYWRGKPGLDRIVYSIVPNADTLFNQLATHEVDVYESIPDNQIARLAGLQGYTVTKRLSANYRRLAFNTAKPVLADVRVRRAIAEAIDWDRMNRTIYHGYNVRAVSDILPTSWAAPAGIAPYPYDLAGAKRLLDAAGLANDAERRADARRRPARVLRLDDALEARERAGRAADAAAARGRRRAARDQELPNQPAVRAERSDLQRPVRQRVHDRHERAGSRQRRAVERQVHPAARREHVVAERSGAHPHQPRSAADVRPGEAQSALSGRGAARPRSWFPPSILYWQTSFSAVNSDLKNWKPASYISNYWNCWEWTI